LDRHCKPFGGDDGVSVRAVIAKGMSLDSTTTSIYMQVESKQNWAGGAWRHRHWMS